MGTGIGMRTGTAAGRAGAGSRRGTGGPGGTATCSAAPPRPAPPHRGCRRFQHRSPDSAGGAAAPRPAGSALGPAPRSPSPRPGAGGRGRVKVRPPEAGSGDCGSSTGCGPRWVAGSGGLFSPVTSPPAVPATPTGPHRWAPEVRCVRYRRTPRDGSCWRRPALPWDTGSGCPVEPRAHPGTAAAAVCLPRCRRAPAVTARTRRGSRAHVRPATLQLPPPPPGGAMPWLLPSRPARLLRADWLPTAVSRR